MGRARTARALLPAVLAVPALLLASACEPVPTPPRNDAFAAAQVLAGTAGGQIATTTVGATIERGEAATMGSSVWYRWTAPTTGATTFASSGGLQMSVGVFTGTSLATLQRAPGTLEQEQQVKTFRVTAGASYYVRASASPASVFTLSWKTSTAPDNDARSSALRLLGDSGSVIADGTAATAEVGDPQLARTSAAATLWYRWTPSADGWYSFDTSGSQADTLLGVFTDTDPLVSLAENDEACSSDESFFGSGASSVLTHVSAGTDYLVAVGAAPAEAPLGKAGVGAPVQLNWRAETTAPVVAGNDAFASPTPISGTHGAVSSSTVAATAEPGEPAHNGQPAASSVWFSWTPTVTADYQLTTDYGRPGDCSARVAVYRGSELSGLTAVPQLDTQGLFGGYRRMTSPPSASYDPTADPGSTTVVRLTAGTTYRVAVDSIDAPAPFTLRWDVPQAAPKILGTTAKDRAVTVTWAPPAAAVGTPRTSYLAMAVPDDDNSSMVENPVVVPVGVGTATLHGLQNGTGYRILVAAVNSAGVGDFAVSGRVVPKR